MTLILQTRNMIIIIYNPKWGINYWIATLFLHARSAASRVFFTLFRVFLFAHANIRLIVSTQCSYFLTMYQPQNILILFLWITFYTFYVHKPQQGIFHILVLHMLYYWVLLSYMLYMYMLLHVTYSGNLRHNLEIFFTCLSPA